MITRTFNTYIVSEYRCLADLRLEDPSAIKEVIKREKGGLLDGSSNWVLEHPSFQRWRDDDRSRVFWIKGDAGKGKTMLLVGIVDELERRFAQPEHTGQPTSPTVGLSYFFCRGTDAHLNNATAVLRGLIFLLAVSQPSLVSYVRGVYQHSGSKLFEGLGAFSSLSKILSKMLRDPSLEKTYIAIDALDECETGLPDLLEFLTQNAKSSRVKWIVSSRNNEEIERQLNLGSSQSILSLELEANAEHVSRVVDAYIDKKVSQLKSLKGNNMLQGQVRDVLRRKAEGTFLWVAIVVQELESVDSYYVPQVISEMPEGLDDLYARMMGQIGQLKRVDPDYCYLVLSAATLAYRPLQLLELSVVSGLPDAVTSNIENVRNLINKSGSFLTVHDDTVYFVHQSAKDYLVKKAASRILPAGLEAAHHRIFQQSLNAMSMVRHGRGVLQRDMYSLRRPGAAVPYSAPQPDPLVAVRYSCVYWIDHLCETLSQDDFRSEIRDGSAMQNFLRRGFLYWTEALSLCGAMSHGIFAIATLERFLEVNYEPLYLPLF